MKEHVSRLLDIKVKGPEGMEIDPIMPIQYYIIKISKSWMHTFKVLERKRKSGKL